MRHLVLGSLGRRISWTLITALLLPLIILAMPTRQAYAQLNRTPTVAVLDFGVLASARSSAILGRNATDAVVVEMSRTGKYDPFSRTQINQQLQELGLTQPLSNNGLQKLGQGLGVEYVVTGDVTSVSFKSNPRRAVVTLSVRLTDVVSGDLANGAIQTGYSPAPPAGMQPDDETLINQALSDGAFNAIKTINNYTLPEATVLQTRGTSEVTLNRGGRDGLTPGLEMTIIRGRDRIGQVRVTTVNATDSQAVVLDYGKGIRPEDHARAIFKLPGYNVSEGGLIQSTVPDTTAYKPQGKRGKPILTTILAVGAAVFLAYLLFDSKNRQNERTGIGKVEARAYADGSVPASLDNSAARVKITWQQASDIPSQNIIEYHIYRDNLIIGVTRSTERQLVDTPVLTYNQVTYTTLVAQNGNQGNNNPGNGTTTAGTTTGTTTTTGGGTTGGTTTGGNTNGNTNGSGSNGPVTLNPVQVTVPVAPMSVGVTHTYQVSVLFRPVQATIPTTNSTTGGGGGGVGGGGVGGGGTTGGGTTGGGTTGGGTTGGGTTNGNTNGNNNTILQETAVRASSGYVTPTARPAANGPTTAKDVRQVQINFNTVQGADQYVFEFASDPSFRNKVVRGPYFVSFSGTATLSEVLDISSDFPDSKVPANGHIYFRVGARAFNDGIKPDRIGTPNGDEYIYSANPISFTKIGTAPPPPFGGS